MKVGQREIGRSAFIRAAAPAQLAAEEAKVLTKEECMAGLDFLRITTGSPSSSVGWDEAAGSGRSRGSERWECQGAQCLRDRGKMSAEHGMAGAGSRLDGTGRGR